MTTPGPEAETDETSPGTFETIAAAAIEDSGELRKTEIEIGWWDVPRLPLWRLSTWWSGLKAKTRSRLRVTVWILALVVPAGLIWLISLALQWKSAQAWEDFLQHFVTSPAAAGTAAVLAAVIAATTFNKGLQQSKDEARDKAWWDKFEWVTDRIVPKDPKQERLPSGLALDLLDALKRTSEGAFQQQAVRGITRTYINGRQTDPATASIGDLRAQWREVQTFADSSWHTGTVTAFIRTYAYNLATTIALREAWDAGKMKFNPTGRRMSDNRIDVLLKHDGKSAVVISRFLRDDPRIGFGYLIPLINQEQRRMITMEAREALKSSVLIFVVNRKLSPRSLARTNMDAVRVLHWEQNHGAEALRDKIQEILRDFVPPVDPPNGEDEGQRTDLTHRPN